ncbi:hypothetical protein IHQ11_28190 [Priestia megaterium]|uniref:hypothetical protein n=1 Tax=Priestia megaterium TaxID=1404 RepID=UPI001B3A3256|nr:hypothetical protein [Priestia megaterium]MBQ4870304.1 hypothetical protein [Priestia megaterium]
MYKKLHKAENTSYLELLPTKGSFLWCVPESCFMLTKDLYHIQLKTKKATDIRQWLFIIYSYKEQITLNVDFFSKYVIQLVLIPMSLYLLLVTLLNLQYEQAY